MVMMSTGIEPNIARHHPTPRHRASGPCRAMLTCGGRRSCVCALPPPSCTLQTRDIALADEAAAAGDEGLRLGMRRPSQMRTHTRPLDGVGAAHQGGSGSGGKHRPCAACKAAPSARSQARHPPRWKAVEASRARAHAPLSHRRYRGVHSPAAEACWTWQPDPDPRCARCPRDVGRVRCRCHTAPAGTPRPDSAPPCAYACAAKVTFLSSHVPPRKEMPVGVREGGFGAPNLGTCGNRFPRHSRGLVLAVGPIPRRDAESRDAESREPRAGMATGCTTHPPSEPQIRYVTRPPSSFADGPKDWSVSAPG
ncbi:unnamed protein product [Diplocarpon coronariae]|nr:hypothetical protein JHW43_007539 [Diplocarpon mali]